MRFLLLLLAGCAQAKTPEPEFEPEAKRCPKPYIEYRNGTKYAPQDDIQIKVASKRCGQLYPESPCVIKIIKVGKLDYHAVCGKG